MPQNTPKPASSTTNATTRPIHPHVSIVDSVGRRTSGPSVVRNQPASLTAMTAKMNVKIELKMSIDPVKTFHPTP